MVLLQDGELGFDDPLAESAIPIPEEQRKLVKESFSQNKLAIGESWYLVAYKWWEFWTDHVNYRQIEGARFGPQPLEIENHDLLDETDHTRVRFGVQSDLDYTLVPAKVWNFFMDWYGGGPAIERQVIQIGTYNPTLQVDVFPISIRFEKANTGSEPWHNLRFSRHTTLKQVLYRACQRYYIPPSKSRLWICFDDADPQPLDPEVLSQTL